MHGQRLAGSVRLPAKSKKIKRMMKGLSNVDYPGRIDCPRIEALAKRCFTSLAPLLKIFAPSEAVGDFCDTFDARFDISKSPFNFVMVAEKSAI